MVSRDARYEWFKGRPDLWMRRRTAIREMKREGLVPRKTYWRDVAWFSLIKRLVADGLLLAVIAEDCY